MAKGRCTMSSLVTPHHSTGLWPALSSCVWSVFFCCFHNQAPEQRGQAEYVGLERRPAVRRFVQLCHSKQRSQRARMAIRGTAGDTAIMVNAKAAAEM